MSTQAYLPWTGNAILQLGTDSLWPALLGGGRLFSILSAMIDCGRALATVKDW
jgi:hypothetical protein